MSRQHPVILATGSAVPDRVVTNAEVDALIGAPTDAWLVANVGIRERRWLAAGQTTSDLVVLAAQRALARAGIAAAQLDLIIVSTDTPDMLSPATATVVQHRLGATRAAAWDLNAACAGWVVALDQAARWLQTEPGARYVLVAGGYAMSRFLDLRDKKTANLFGDGAGAAVLGCGDQAGWLASRVHTIGAYHDALGIYGGGAARPSTAETVAQYGAPHVEFVRPFPRNFNTEVWPQVIDDALRRAGLGLAAVDHFFFTQLNLRTIEAVMQQLGQPLGKTHWVMDRWGYTGSPCVVMALDDAISRGRGPRPGQVVLFCASGGGITVAASVWRWAAHHAG
jgi:3-oxoacyl-[acyl-carrier-protein] synthase-3